MKYIIFFFVFIIPFLGWSQENSMSLSGGYSFQNIEDADENATGWRINFAYEFNPFQGKVSHGVGLGYISTGVTVEVVGQQTLVYDLNTIPVYYSPKFIIGKESFKGFVKGALGIHFSSYEKTGIALIVSDNSTGFYDGAGLGLAKIFNDKFFLKF